MIYASVCSGIECATVAWSPLGWSPAWFAEIAPFPSALLEHRYPEVENRGDFTQITDGPAFDLLVGGSPCQDFSVAGPRAGLDGARGVLAWEFLRLAGRARPRWLVWENVPGVLSSGSGRDFGALLGALGELGYGWAYRVLDAQHFGLAQRRKRVFVVGHLGDWRAPFAVLFERASLSWDPAPSGGEGADVAGALGCGSSTSGGRVGRPLLAHGQRIDAESEDFVLAFHATQDPISGAQSPALSSRGQVAVFDEAQITSANNRATVTPGAPSPTLIAASRPRARSLSGEFRPRRLTPVEWEALFGFPRNYTLIPYNGKPARDGPRYTALGNSMAVPVMRWIGERIAAVDVLVQQREATA